MCVCLCVCVHVLMHVDLHRKQWLEKRKYALIFIKAAAIAAQLH